jgi:hypothetical protein
MRRTVARMSGLVVLLAAVSVRASGLLPTEALPGEPRAAWAAEVARTRRERPQAFERLARVVEEVEALDAAKRGPLAVLTPHLKGLGPEALWPMVERLVFAPEAPVPEETSARLALTVGLVEAAGALRDARLEPLWKALLEGTEARPLVLHAAAEALAKLDSDEAARVLVRLSREGGPRGEAALAGMGNCRRLVVARALAGALEARPEAARARLLIRALGDVGSAWAWRTPAVKARAEEGRVRHVAAEALLRAYLSQQGEVRQAASNALLRVDAPETASLLTASRQGASDAQRAALDALAERLRRNPLRREDLR